METSVVSRIVSGLFSGLVVLETSRYLFRRFFLYSEWIRVSSVSVTCLFLAVCGISGLLVFTLGPADLILSFSLGAGIVFSLVHPVAAVAILVSNLLLRPWEALPESELLAVVPRLLAVVAGASWLVSRFLHRKASFIWTRSLTGFTALFVWLAVSAWVSALGEDNLGDLLKVFLPVFVVGVLMVNAVETGEDVSLLKRTVALSVTGVIASAVAMTVMRPEFGAGSLRLQGMGMNGNANDLASLLLLGIPFIFIRAKRTVWDLGCIVVLLGGLLLSQSRAAMIALGCSYLIYLWITSESKMRILVQFALFGVFLVPFAVFILLRREESDLGGSYDARWNYIVSGLRMLKAHPFIGVGTFNYPRFYDQFTTLYIETTPHVAHSSWMMILTETGPVGLLLFGGLFAAAVKKAWEMRRTYPEFIVSLAGYGVTMSLLTHCYLIYPYLLIFLTLSAARVVRP